MRNAIFSGYYIEILEEMIIFVCSAVIGRYMCRNYLSIQQKIMKIKSLFAAVMASAMAFVACENEKTDLGTPSIALSLEEVTLEAAGGEATVDVTATRDWTVKFDETADWLVVDPASGTASADAQKVTVSALSNEGYDREVSVEFSIGMQTKYLTVKQVGPKGSADALVVYGNNFDKTKAEKGDRWSTYLDTFDGWRNETGVGIASVTYASKSLTARTNSGNGSAGKYSDYIDLGASGMNYLWFGTAPTYFAVKNITLPEGQVDYTLSFGTERYEYAEDKIVDNTFKWDEFSVYVSADAKKWVKLSCDFAGGSLPNGRWDLASSTFTLPAGTTSLSLYFTSTYGAAYAIDDLNLVQAETAGTTIDFATGVEIEVVDNITDNSGDNTGGGSTSGTEPTNLVTATIKEFLAAAESSDTWYKLTGKIINIEKEDYGNFTIKDETGEVYIYGMTSKWVGSNDKSFSKIGLKVGDTVTLGTLRGSYQGTPQGGGNKVPAFYISHVSGAGDGTSDGGNTGGDNTGGGNTGGDVDTGSGDYDASIVFKDAGYQNEAKVTEVKIDENITAVFAKGTANNDPAYYDNGEAVRMYQNGSTLDIKAAEGKTITEIRFTFAQNHYYIGCDAGTLSAEAATRVWKGSANAVKFTTTGTDKSRRAYVASIEVAYE